MRKTPLIALALSFALAQSASAAVLIYDGFDYTVGQPLTGQINPGSSFPWAAAGGAGDPDDQVIANDNLSVPGLAASTGSAAAYGGVGKTERLAIATNQVTSGTVWYSFAFKITDTTGTAVNGAFIAGLNTATLTQGTQPGAVFTRTLIKPGSQAGTYQIGLDRSAGSSGGFVFDGVDRNLNDVQYVVGSWEIVAGANNDIARLWINPNPADFGAAVAPAPTIQINNPGAQADGNPWSFLLRQNATAGVPAGIVADELRVGTTWGDVTPPVPEPAAIGALALLGLSVARRPRA